MKLARFTEGGRSRLGVVVDDGIVDLSRAAPELPTDVERHANFALKRHPDLRTFG